MALFLPWYRRDTDIAGAVITQTWTAWQALPVITTVLFLVAVAAVAGMLAAIGPARRAARLDPLRALQYE